MKSSVGITLELVPAAPILSMPVDQQVEENHDHISGCQCSAVYNYTVTSRANGPDQYLMSSELIGGDNIQAAPYPQQKLANHSLGWQVPEGIDRSITLGATTVVEEASQGANIITVISDGIAVGTTESEGSETAENASVNGIVVNDLVVIGVDEYKVTAVSDNGVEGEITLDPALSLGVSVGELVAERRVFSVELEAFDVVDDEEQVTTVGVVVSARVASRPDMGDSDFTLTRFYVPAEKDLKAYVRNEREEANPGEEDVAYISLSKEQFYPADNVTAVSGDILKYAIVQKAGTSGPLIDVVLKANISPFTTYETGSTVLNNGDQPLPDADLDSPLLVGIDAGTIAAFDLAEVTFKVKLDEPTGEDTSDQGKVAWTEGEDACWNAPIGNWSVNGWVVGSCEEGFVAGEQWEQADCNSLATAWGSQEFLVGDVNVLNTLTLQSSAIQASVCLP